MNNLRTFALSFAALLLSASAAMAQVTAPVQPQAPVEAPRPPAYRAVTYDVHASVFPAEQRLSAQATVEFEAGAISSNLECELHPNLRINSINDADGNAVEFERDFGNPLVVRITLPDGVPAGERVTLTFDYSGQLPNEQNNSPVPGTRVAWVGAQGAYLLLPGRWFPLTQFPSNRYTGTFSLDVPENFVVAGTGVSDGPAVAPSVPVAPPEPEIPELIRNRNPNPNPNLPPPPTVAPPGPRTLYTFRVDRPQAAGTFVVGALQRSPVQAEGLNISVFSPGGAADTAAAYGAAVAHIVNVFSSQFGALPQPNLTLAQIPDGTVTGYAAPGLLLVSARHWTPQPDTRLLSNLAASQWWGDQVMAASPSDVWITDGLARYSEALYIEQSSNPEAVNRVLEDFAVGALMYEDAAPIAEARQLTPLTTEYQSVVVNKGAMVFHMLRAQLEDPSFFALLRDFYVQYSGKQATIADFERIADSRLAGAQPPPSPDAFAIRVNAAPVDNTAPTLHPFFVQWLNSTGVPEFDLDYTVFRTPKGFRIIGKIKQPLDVFHATVELQVLTEGNPELKTVEINGTESDFEVETFGRPKAGGITLDPHDYILKSSPRLRVRAIIARGEALAEQSRFYDAIQQYAQALDIQRNQALAQFRMGEVFFYQKNYQASANSFRGALDGDIDPVDKWVEVWSHIYLGKIFDISGDRTRAVNEYSRAQQTNDDTGGAQAEAGKYIASPYTERPG